MLAVADQHAAVRCDHARRAGGPDPDAIVVTIQVLRVDPADRVVFGVDDEDVAAPDRPPSPSARRTPPRGRRRRRRHSRGRRCRRPSRSSPSRMRRMQLPCRSITYSEPSGAKATARGAEQAGLRRPGRRRRRARPRRCRRTFRWSSVARSTTRTRWSATSAMNRRVWSGLSARPFGSTSPAVRPGRHRRCVADAVAGQGRICRGIDHAHAPVQPVGEKHPARTVDDDAVRLVQQRARGRTAIAGESLFTGAANRGDHPRAGIDPAEAMIERIGKNQAAVGQQTPDRTDCSGARATLTIRRRNSPGSPVPATTLTFHCHAYVMPILPPRRGTMVVPACMSSVGSCQSTASRRKTTMDTNVASPSRTAESTRLYDKLEDRCLMRDQKGASDVYYELVRAGRPLNEIVAEGVRIHAPYTHVPYHERIDDGYPNFVNNDHCLLSARATINLTRMLPRASGDAADGADHLVYPDRPGYLEPEDRQGARALHAPSRQSGRRGSAAGAGGLLAGPGADRAGRPAEGAAEQLDDRRSTAARSSRPTGCSSG